MKFAHFAHVWGKKGMTPAQRYEQLWRELQLCDELGFDYGFCVEHHFSPDESWMSAPSLYTVGAGARTKRMRLGGMGHIVPLHQSLRLAEEIAIADQMLGGRLDIGLVPGITPRIFEPFGVDFENRREVTLEFVQVPARRLCRHAELHASTASIITPRTSRSPCRRCRSPARRSGSRRAIPRRSNSARAKASMSATS